MKGERSAIVPLGARTKHHPSVSLLKSQLLLPSSTQSNSSGPYALGWIWKDTDKRWAGGDYIRVDEGGESASIYKLRVDLKEAQMGDSGSEDCVQLPSAVT